MEAEIAALAQTTDARQLCEMEYISNNLAMTELYNECIKAAAYLLQHGYKREASAFAALAKCIEGAFMEFGASPSLFNSFVVGRGTGTHPSPVAIFYDLRESVIKRLGDEDRKGDQL